MAVLARMRLLNSVASCTSNMRARYGEEVEGGREGGEGGEEVGGQKKENKQINMDNKM